MCQNVLRGLLTICFLAALFTPAGARASEGCLTSSCHTQISEAAFAHGPVAAGQCMVCHEGDPKLHPEGDGAEFDLMVGAAKGLCLECHTDFAARKLDQTLHFKVDCAECHSPHGGNTSVFVEREGNLFCTLCHREVGMEMGGHPIAGHPMEANSLPKFPKQKLTCASCHLIHKRGDISTRNLMDDTSLQRKFCQKCH